jgi:hypothetical protein
MDSHVICRHLITLLLNLSSFVRGALRGTYNTWYSIFELDPKLVDDKREKLNADVHKLLKR